MNTFYFIFIYDIISEIFIERTYVMKPTKRNIEADIIRILAFFSVISVHFFLYNGFYVQPIEGKRMFAMTNMRSFFIVCVPLFLTLSGFLLRKKELEKGYYKRISKIITTYLLASFVCVLYRIVLVDQNLTIKDIVLKVLNFSAAPYSWYIEMYIGLFLLIPFLNIMYNNLPSQKYKIWLIITFVTLTSLPSVLNIYNLNSFEWFPFPSLTQDNNKLIPDWWQSLYPITYYYIGCYLGEYGVKINRILNVLLIFFCTLVSGTFCYWRSYKTQFICGAWCDYMSLFNIILTLFIFTFFININYDKMPMRLRIYVQKISSLCLGGYLVSWIFDNTLYSILRAKISSNTLSLRYYIISVPIIFTLSLSTSYLISEMQNTIEKTYISILNYIGEKRKKQPQHYK